MLLEPLGWAAVAYAVASRLAYVLFVGIALRRQERHETLTRRHGVEGGFRWFRRIASVLMLNDGGAFILLCVVTRDTLGLDLPRAAAIALGAALVVLGVWVKVWAAATLGGKAYYWYNFFEPPPVSTRAPVLAGPYRFLANPMYTVGYLQTYGLALITGSLPGLAAAALAQAAILVFYRAVERPHFQRLHGS
jgi:protein-S-isoprenylcysteine O-methyltransferase Ste14